MDLAYKIPIGLGKNPSWEAFQPNPCQHGPIPKPTKKFLVKDPTYKIPIGLWKKSKLGDFPTLSFPTWPDTQTHKENLGYRSGL